MSRSPQRFAGWLGGVAQGDFGTTITGVEITNELVTRVGVTLRLLLIGTVVGVVAGVLVGVASAIRQYRLGDYAATVFSFVVLSIPVFVMAQLEIDQLYEQAIRTLDDKRRIELGQRIDQALWNLMPQLPLYQSTGAYAVRVTLANFGASGFRRRRLRGHRLHPVTAVSATGPNPFLQLARQPGD